ncbi:MAG: OmcA/MtrC family decaheme c-type cytochrome [Halioglobus sp.]
MATHMRNWLLAGLMGLLVACGGGGGGNSASGVEAGPPPPGQSIPPEPLPPVPSATPYAEAEVLHAFITSATLNGDNQPLVQFTLSDGNNVAITDLTAGDVRFVVSKLETSPLGNLTGTWQSYINQIEQANPDVGTGTEPRLQATYEREEEGFSNNGDGNYSYQYATSLTDLPQDELDQAAAEDLDLSYDPNLTHRVAIQFDGAPGKANPNYDWVPQTGATEGIFTMDIAATDNCNRCHDPLAIHGGGRQEVKYCVTCHNAGSTDANSTNTVDFKVMVHKIHAGANLPSVQAGGEYAIYGFRNSKHDYSNLHYPQDIRNCVNCHVGTGTVGDREDLVLTSQGDNWSEVPSAAACGSCHDDQLEPDGHIGSKPDDSGCASCHSEGGRAGSIADSHRILTAEAGERFAAEILMVTNTAPGEFPQVQYKIFDPTNGDAPYDLQNDPVWTAGGGASRLAIDLAWDTVDYTNTGNGMDEASAVSLDALQGTAVGDGSYTIESELAIPDGSLDPGIAATGSGVATVEGHPAVNFGSEEEPDVQRIAFTNVHEFFSIDEADGTPNDRRVVAELEGCLSCHSQLSLHGNNRTDDLQVCVACHNPRNTDRQVREVAASPPTDGKDEESIDFKRMIHGIHAAAMRENALQIVGFRGFTTYVYDEEAVHFPGDLSNCLACHTEDGYTLPLADGVLGTTIDTGEDHESPLDDTVITPTTAVCSSCHDDSLATAHMTSNGGSFDTSQQAIDSGEVVEQCALCHGTGRDQDVAIKHNVHVKPL